MVGYIIQSKPKNIFNGGIDKVMMEEQPEDNDGDMTECLQNWLEITEKASDLFYLFIYFNLQSFNLVLLHTLLYIYIH